MKGGFYIQDLWINRPFRGNGYFMNMMSQVMKFIDLNKDEYACTVLRAYSENPDVPNEKLSEIYQRFGFSEVQETEDDEKIIKKKKKTEKDFMRYHITLLFFFILYII